MKKFIPAILALSLIASSCESLFGDLGNNGNDDETDEPTQEEVLSSNIALDDNAQKHNLISFEEQVIEIGFIAEGYWQAEALDPWIQVAPQSGEKGHHTLLINVERNDSADTRMGEVALSGRSGGNLMIILIEQEEERVFYVEDDVVTVDYGGGEIYANVATNADYDVYIPEEASEWLEYLETRAIRNETIVFRAYYNDSLEERRATVELRSYNDDTIQSFTVIQHGKTKDFFAYCNDNIPVEAAGKTLDIYISTNFDYIIDIPEEAASWIKHTDTVVESTNDAGKRWETIYLDVLQNDKCDERSATLSFTDNNGTVYKSVTITQNAITTITYTTTDGNTIDIFDYFDVDIISNTYENGEGRILFEGKLTMIGEGAMSNLKNLATIDLPETIISIGKEAFKGCTALTTIAIPESVTTIGNNAFYGCTALKEITLNNTLTEIPYGLLRDCTAISSIEIPKCVTKVCDYAFKGCESLVIDTIPENIAEIGYDAFYGCKSLKSLHISNTLKVVDSGAFNECDNLKEVHIDDLSAWCGIEFKHMSSNPLYCGNFLYVNGSMVTDLVIPNDVTELKANTFSKCLSIYNITIGDHVTRIGDYAFYQCEPRSVSIGNGVKEIGKYAFGYCENTETISLGNNIETIGEGAFSECESVKTMKLPSKVKTIGASAFEYCDFEWLNIPSSVETIGDRAFFATKIDELHITSLAKWCAIDFETETATPGRSNIYVDMKIYLNDNLIEDLDIPAGVTEIKSYAFYSWEAINSITIPDSVTSIGESAFCKCDNLKELNIGKGVTNIGNYAFTGCYVDDVVIPSSVKRIGKGAFNSVINNSLTFDGGVETIEEEAFRDCKIKILELKHGVKTIEGEAFRSCTKLTTVTIPSTVTYMGQYCFGYCSVLNTVYCKPTTPPSVNTDYSSVNIFNQCANDLVVYVPRGSYSDYLVAYGWRTYEDILEAYDF